MCYLERNFISNKGLRFLTPMYTPGEYLRRYEIDYLVFVREYLIAERDLHINAPKSVDMT